jgi:integrase
VTIRKYIDGTGKELFKVKVKKASKQNRSISVQKQQQGITSFKDAKKIEANLIEQAQREVFERECAGESFGSVVEAWYSAQYSGFGMERPVSRITAGDNSRSLHIYCSHLFKLRARDITRAHVRDIIERMDVEGKSNSRKRHVKGCIHGAIMWGIENGHIKGITQSPCVGIKVSRFEEKKPEILTIAEIRKLLQAALELNHPWYYVWAGALQTGARSGELYALEWTDVDWDNRRLNVAKSWNGRLKQYKSTKSGYWRDVPINSELERILKILRSTAGDRKWVYPRMVDWQRGESARILRAFCQGIGIPSVRLHALRACFATQLLRDSVAPAVVMKICGWNDLKTMQRYIRLAGIEIEGATDGLKILPPDQAMGRVVELFGGSV